MAYQPQQIPPSDFQTDVVNGVDLPFSSQEVFSPNYTTADALKSSIINYFLTNPGERPLNPLFGGGLRNFIFTQIQEDNLEFLEQDIQNKFKSEFPTVSVVGLEIIQNRTDFNEITVEIKYSVDNTNIEDSLTLNFE